MLKLEACSSPEPVVEVLSAALPHEEIDEARIARQILLDPNFREDGSLLARDNGRPVGYCWAVRRRVPLENAPDDSDRGYIILFALRPDAWGRGVEGCLLSGAEAYLKASGCRSCWISPYAPGYFTPGIDEIAQADVLSFLCQCGYEVKSRPLAMQLDLDSLQVPGYVEANRAEVEIQAYEPALTVPLLRFAEQSFCGDWVRFARDAARAIVRGDDPGRLQIASAGGTVVGFSHYEGSRFGPIGVSKEVEGRGVGSALMFRTLRAMQASGTKRAWFLWTDDQTAARFYAPWGWREWRRFAVLGKELRK